MHIEEKWDFVMGRGASVSYRHISSLFLFQYKKRVADSLTKNALPLFIDGASPSLRPIIDTVLPFHKVADAHRLMESNQNTGKIVLQIRNEQSGETIHDEL